jgi:hypothetical protein
VLFYAPRPFGYEWFRCCSEKPSDSCFYLRTRRASQSPPAVLVLSLPAAAEPEAIDAPRHAPGSTYLLGVRSIVAIARTAVDLFARKGYVLLTVVV